MTARYTNRLTDVIGVAIRKTDAYVLVEQVLEIKPEVGVDEVAGVLERVVDTVGARVVERHSEGLLHLWQIEVVRVVRRWRGVVIFVSDVIDTAAAVVVVRRLDVVSAHVSRFVAELHDAGGQSSLRDGRVGVVVAGVAFGCGAAQLDLVEAAIVHVVGEFGIGVNRVVVGFDAVGAGNVSQLAFLTSGL